MLTIVFLCQPLGQLAATLVALIASARQRDGIRGDATVTHCVGECASTLDSIWRWVIGVGVIPAVIALWFRLTIIESPRYTADVGQDSKKAASELTRYLPSEIESEAASVTSVEMPPYGQFAHRASVAGGDGNSVPFDRRSSDAGSFEGGPNTDNHLLENGTLSDTSENKPPPPPWKEFKKYFWLDGNIRTLAATSLCWFCVDLPF
jgi:PHS family inorganic phosphate transporter-like MFS transporter